MECNGYAIEQATGAVLSLYRGGAPSRERLDAMLGRCVPRQYQPAVEKRLQEIMGMAYPKREGRR